MEASYDDDPSALCLCGGALLREVFVMFVLLPSSWPRAVLHMNHYTLKGVIVFYGTDSLAYYVMVAYCLINDPTAWTK